MSNEIVKEYTNGEITVVWKPKTCIHSKKCWKGLIEVFDPREKPWVKMDGANSETIMNQVNDCPSGALSYYKNDAKPTSKSNHDNTQTTISVSENGPLLLKGSIRIKHTDGKVEMKESAALCRCGFSENKPFCDGSHQTKKWSAD